MKIFILLFAPCFTDWCVEAESQPVAAYETAEDCQHIAELLSRSAGIAWCEEAAE